MSPTKKCLQQIGYGIDKNKYHKLKEISNRFALIGPPTNPMYVTKAYRIKCMRNIHLTTVAHRNCPTPLPGWF